MTECRPNNLYFDLIHKSLTDLMDLLEIAKKIFVSVHSRHFAKLFHNFFVNSTCLKKFRNFSFVLVYIKISDSYGLIS